MTSEKKTVVIAGLGFVGMRAFRSVSFLRCKGPTFASTLFLDGDDDLRADGKG